MRVGLPQAGGFFLLGSSDSLGKFLWGKLSPLSSQLCLLDHSIVACLVPAQGSSDQNSTLCKER